VRAPTSASTLPGWPKKSNGNSRVRSEKGLKDLAADAADRGKAG
jgi:hypothetical protein